MALLQLPPEDVPQVLNRVQVWRHTWPHHHIQLPQQGSFHLGGVFGVVIFRVEPLLENLCMTLATVLISVSGSYHSSYSLGQLCGEQQF